MRALLVLCAAATLAAAGGYPMATNFVVTETPNILQEGVLTEVTRAYQAGQRMAVKSASPYGNQTQLYFPNENGGTNVMQYYALGAPVCTVIRNIGAPLPAIPQVPHYPFAREAFAAELPATERLMEYRLQVGKYQLAEFDRVVAGSGTTAQTLPYSMTNYYAMAEHKRIVMQNDSYPPHGYFDWPAGCNNNATVIVVDAAAPRNDAEKVLAARARAHVAAAVRWPRVPPVRHSTWFDGATLAATPRYAAVPAGYTPPPSLDNRAFANPPRNQGLECGSCWSFASAGVAEIVYNYAVARTPADPKAPNYFAPQALMDCVHTTVSQGCLGGSGPEALAYIAANGIPLEVDYPYQAMNGPTCNAAQVPPTRIARPITGTQLIYPWNETTVMHAIQAYGAVLGGQKELTSGPMADQSMYYSGGVYDNPACTPDLPGGHVIMYVGWGNDAVTGAPYWLIRNSLGNGWGEGGFIRVRRGANVCGTEQAAFVVVPNV